MSPHASRDGIHRAKGQRVVTSARSSRRARIPLTCPSDRHRFGGVQVEQGGPTLCHTVIVTRSAMRYPVAPSSREPAPWRSWAARCTRPRRRPPGPGRWHRSTRRSATWSSRAPRTGRSTITSATRRRCRRPASGRHPATRSRTRTGTRTSRSSSRASRRPTRRTTGARCMSNGTAGRWTASTRTLRRRSATATRRSASTRPTSCPSTTACWTTRRSSGTSSARCLGRPGRTASTSRPARRAESPRTASGDTASSTTRSSSTCSTPRA